MGNVEDADCAKIAHKKGAWRGETIVLSRNTREPEKAIGKGGGPSYIRPISAVKGRR